MGLTTDRNDPALHVDRGDGQNEKYLVLSDEERAKGFVRPVRRSYVHVGIAGPTYELRDLTPRELEIYGNLGYAKYEPYPKTAELPHLEPAGRTLGRFWTQEQLDKIDKGCGARTTMGGAIAETYARSPGFYGSTFCCRCGAHLPVGRDGEFVWDGTNERVGT